MHSVKKIIKQNLYNSPRLYDTTIRTYRKINSTVTPAYEFFDNFSRAQKKKVCFIQIGANDGLRNDPIREFIIRDKWQGILVEPIPFVFDELKHNYHYLHRNNLRFVNAAITSVCDESISFWTFSDHFLNSLTKNERYIYLRKSAFNKNHLIRLLKNQSVKLNPNKILRELKVPTLTLMCLVERYWMKKHIDLLIIDAEGHESTIIPNIDLNKLQPKAIFFEWVNLEEKEKDVFSFLENNGYEITKLNADAVAILKTSILKVQSTQNHLGHEMMKRH